MYKYELWMYLRPRRLLRPRAEAPSVMAGAGCLLYRVSATACGDGSAGKTLSVISGYTCLGGKVGKMVLVAA